ncbi:MAG: ABC transporter ATP-binding protein/permease [Spirochaetales bacterium]|jgi:ABC-type multidrug transport system fused ATPase/permease subunit|nr:ABC transporter ATP-binding protein/permease [Spirochaetales bacterium]
MAAFIQFLRLGTRGIILLVLPCVLAACSYSLIPAVIAVSLDRPRAAGTDALLGPAAASALAAALGLCGWIFGYITRRMAAVFAADFAFRVRREVFGKVLTCNADFPESYINAVEELILPAVDFLGRFLFLLVLAFSLVYIRPLPALMVILLVPAAFLLTRALRVGEKKYGSGERQQTAQLEKRFAALLRALPFTKQAGHIPDFLPGAFRETGDAFCRLRVRGCLALAPVFPLTGCAAGLALALFVYAAGRVLAAEMTAGVWFLCLAAIPAIFLNVRLMSAFQGRLGRALAAAQRLQAILEMQPERRPSGRESALHLKGELKLAGLCASGGEEKLLEGVSLLIPAGQKVALVGGSSGSLSCFLRVLARLYEYDEGELRIDEKDIRELDIGELREKIDFVPGEAFLFEGTLEENIRCGRPTASDEEIRLATAKLGRGDWLYDLPDGLSTRTDPGKPAPVWAWLVLLARSLLKKPAVCIIDEIAPSGDPLTEVRIQEALYTLTAGRTTVIAARRLSTLRQADRIIVFDGGRIAEEGVHEELLARKGVYAKIYENSFRHQSPDYFARQD